MDREPSPKDEEKAEELKTPGDNVENHGNSLDIENSNTSSSKDLDIKPAEVFSSYSDPSKLEAQQQSTTLQADVEASAAADVGVAASNGTEVVHSAFSKYEKIFIVVMITMAGFFSPLSGQIYYPVLPTLVDNYQLTHSLINLSITTYMILQGLAPSFIGTFADQAGRRPAYIIAFVIYTAANIGLALQNSYAALMVLRCLQSAGSSGVVSFGYGVIADITVPADRGKYVGPMAAGVMVAPALGPVIGGLLAKFLGWKSVFWFLVIISGGYLIAFAISVPETARSIVGNGSVPPNGYWRKSIIQCLQERHRVKQMSADERSAYEEQRARIGRGNGTKLTFPNPLKSFAILLEKDALIIISYIGLVMFSNIALLTSTPRLFGDLYGFNDLEIGLCFLPLGVSACFGAILTGKLNDWNFCRAARKLDIPTDRTNNDLRNFPIERNRLETVFPLMAIGIAAFIPYGWALRSQSLLATPLVLQFVIGFCFVGALNTLNTLLVDLFPDRASTASAACNLVRSWLGAVGAATIEQMLDGMGWSWCFAFLGILMAAAMGLLWVEYLYGMKWRERRVVKIEQRMEQREDDSNHGRKNTQALMQGQEMDKSKNGQDSKESSA